MIKLTRILTATAVAALIAGGALAETDPSAKTDQQTNPSGEVLMQTQADTQTGVTQDGTATAQTDTDAAAQSTPDVAQSAPADTTDQPSTDVAGQTDGTAGTDTATSRTDMAGTDTATPTDGSTTADQAGGGMTEIAEIAVANQPVENGTVTIASAYMPEAGFVALHELSDQRLSPDAVGYAPLQKGQNDNVTVQIDGTLPDDAILVAMLHKDTGETGTYEFSAQTMNVDQPETVDGAPVGVPFLVLAQADPAAQDSSPNSSTDVMPQAQTN